MTRGRMGVWVGYGLLGAVLLGCVSLTPGPAAPGDEPEAVVRRAWWQSSNPSPSGELTLEKAIREALKASPELNQIQSRLEAAAQQIRQAEAAFYPRVVFSEEFQVTDNPVVALMHIINQRRLKLGTDLNDPGQQHNISSRIQGEWSLFEGGRRWYHRAAAIHRRDALHFDLLAARNRLVSAVTETYYRWLQSLGFIQVAQRALKAARADERLAEARVHAQTALPSELLRLKTRTAEAHHQLVLARTSALRLRAALERLLARPLGDEEIPHLTFPQDPSPFLPEPVESTSSLVEEALRQRPEMAAIREMVLAARDRIRAARGDLLPRIGTRGHYQWDTEDLRDGADSWMVGIQLTWPLFQGGTTLARIREARARLKEAQAQGKQMALDIALEVHQAALAIQEAVDRIRVAAERKQWAARGLKETQNLYRNEVVTVDALLQAEVALNRAEVAYTAALFDGMIAQAALRKALGVLARNGEEDHE